MWIFAVALFGTGDLATTIVFIEIGAGVEGNPIVAPVVESVGTWILVPWKFAAIGVFYLGYRVVPKQIRIGIPIGLTLVGAALTGWNLYGWYLGHNPIPIF
ncbi:hypothetical protein BB347_18735 (plasmid) [Natronorubrum daqingense]|nr:hypothetical protein BB347_18735 [Natronorubrum daqingense]